MPRANRQEPPGRTRACITIDLEVYAAAKAYAESEGRSFSNLVEWALRQITRKKPV